MDWDRWGVMVKVTDTRVKETGQIFAQNPRTPPLFPLLRPDPEVSPLSSSLLLGFVWRAKLGVFCKRVRAIMEMGRFNSKFSGILIN